MSSKDVIVRVKDLGFSYGAAGPAAVEGVSFDVSRGRVLGIVGANGSGKSTVLKVILCHSISGGASLRYGRFSGRVQVLLSKDDRVGFLSQDYRNSLFPWMTLEANFKAALRWSRASTNGIPWDRIEGLLHDVGLPVDHLRAKLRSHPGELSGGEQQIAAFARTLACEPKLLLLDEPFAAADPKYRRMLRNAVLRYRDRTGASVIIVSHDLHEAVYLCDEIIALSRLPRQEAIPRAAIDHRFPATVVGGLDAPPSRPEAGAGTVGCQFQVNLPRPRNFDELGATPVAREYLETLYRCIENQG